MSLAEVLRRDLANVALSARFFEIAPLYAEFLLRWNKTHNITSAANESQIARHIALSVYPLKFLPEFENCLDIGSGAGFPAAFLAIACEKAKFYLCEPIAKKWAFLAAAIAEFKLANAFVLPFRVENLRENANFPQKFDLVTSRAVGNAKEIYNLASGYMKSNTNLLLYKGEKTAEEADTIDAEKINAPFATYLLKRGA
ncbi:MAG: 16S rRNA (guanine(527)-N(7))-methyltransferase RsmG [Helicobacteraceae bacterium]|jgi:16S rRNA (guanine527-N7)-methyltransferase|nr:16S rRNA (guanine(527)-N(7))-methyltransferase RsmG [Helicobacteraceae bacterium]